MQLCSSEELGPSQQTVNRVISETLAAFNTPHIMRRYLTFPTENEVMQQNKAEFMEIANFPGLVGVIDYTHIRITAPKEFPDEYINRKGYHSINVQIVFNARCEVVSCLAKWPGSVRDSGILSESGLKQCFDAGIIPRGCSLLGDHGYPCKPWLVTPYLNPQPGPQANYNIAHSKTRNVVERGIDQLKRRFPVLHTEIRVSPSLKVCQIVYVCAVLHNICKRCNVPLDDEHLDNQNAAPDHDVGAIAPAAWGQDNGRTFRDHFTATHFSNKASTMGLLR
ncbi:putative nuclease HARBI1 [Eriocheir sinensis]|uniref:putative nuclease HARBI1 n=1 Tax=Eriocheir sinensis TaxID=95602 RepID=UPI0021C9A097|nr:putative nuclease HARBI1 [Eriocheir sinensis]